MRFERFIGVDYSGANEPLTPISGLRVYAGSARLMPQEILPEEKRTHWSRATVYQWLREQLCADTPTLIGLDHGFSFPKLFFLRHQLERWDAFLSFFVQKMPSHELSVEALRQQHRLLFEPTAPLRLCEMWTAGAKSVFQFDMQGSVAKSTYAGLPWLHKLRAEFGARLFFWPFDGWQPPSGVHVICEAYPALYKRRYRRGDMKLDAFDAFAIARWMQDMQQREVLHAYFQPPLNAEERALAALEGWILGVR